MAERVYPADSPPQSGEFSDEFPKKPASYVVQLQSGEFSGEFPKKPATYVVQFPKDQIYRVPPPENAHRVQHLSRKNTNRSCCRCCLCSFLALILILIAIFAILYVIIRPKAPSYSVEGFQISGFNLTSSSPISPKFNVTMRSRNRNGNLGIYYEKGSSVDVYYRDVDISHGALPTFYQPAKNVTVIKTALTGSQIQLTSSMRNQMSNEVNNKTMTFKLKIRSPVKIKIGAVKTWSIVVKVNCDVTVDKLTAPTRIVSIKCSHDVDLW